MVLESENAFSFTSFIELKIFKKGNLSIETAVEKDRKESKDPADYYNVTVSMMIKRNPKELKTFEKAKTIDGKALSQAIDKGFPYDEVDLALGEHTKSLGQMTIKEVVGKMNGEKVT